MGSMHTIQAMNKFTQTALQCKAALRNMANNSSVTKKFSFNGRPTFSSTGNKLVDGVVGITMGPIGTYLACDLIGAPLAKSIGGDDDESDHFRGYVYRAGGILGGLTSSAYFAGPVSATSYSVLVAGCYAYGKYKHAYGNPK